MPSSLPTDRRRLVETAFELFAEPLYVYLHRMLGDDGESESLTQECFLRLWASEAAFPHEGALRAWLYRVARNLVFDRSKRRRPRLLSDEAGEDGDARSDPFERHDEATGPAERLEQAEDAARMRAALERLPELYRSTLVLRYLEEWSYEALAELEGVSVSALRTRIHKGLQLLRAEMPELGAG